MINHKANLDQTVDRLTMASTSITSETYRRLYQAALVDPDAFWAQQARQISWMRRPTRIKNTSFAPGNVSIKWYEDGTLNVAANCIDRHVVRNGDRTAIIREPDDPNQPAPHISYPHLLE